MSLFNPFIMANRNGIPRIEATGVNVSTTAVTFSFQRNAFYNRNVTSAELNQSGVYLGFYDGNTLQLLTGV